MSFAWEDYLEVADHLANNAPDPKSEAYFRASVSRSYYACHKSLHKWLETNTQFIPNRQRTTPVPGIHTDILNAIPVFIQSPQASTIQRLLKHLLLTRRVVDYEDNPKQQIDKAYTLARLNDARAILHYLSKATPK